MELTVAKKDLLKIVARMQGVAERKSTMPVLANVLLAVDGQNGMRLAATDLYLSLLGRVPAEVSTTTGTGSGGTTVGWGGGSDPGHGRSACTAPGTSRASPHGTNATISAGRRPPTRTGAQTASGPSRPWMRAKARAARSSAALAPPHNVS